jgi:ribosomal protein S18 acetylase RimI-like enzyme
MPEVPLCQVVHLSSVSTEALEPLLNEEVAAWERRFRWDFRPSADLLRRFTSTHSLEGFALRAGNQLLGYVYHVFEGHKALIGDFYLRDAYARPFDEMLLLSAAVQALTLMPGVQRIESQLMMLHPAPTASLPFNRFLTRYDRLFMEIAPAAIRQLPPASVNFRVAIVPWREKHQEEIARLLSSAYRGHIDSEINDQYRTAAGARQFLANIIKFPGCGRFSPSASLVAIDEHSGRICGVCLGSLIAPQSGHVTQLCVLPGVRGARLGYQLLRESLLRFVELGCRNVSLTVTESNVDAVRLYRSVGFQSEANFPALVWEGF